MTPAGSVTESAIIMKKQKKKQAKIGNLKRRIDESLRIQSHTEAGKIPQTFDDRSPNDIISS